MGDVSIPKPPPNKVGAKVQELIDSGHEFYATAVTGAPAGRTRRPTLFAIAIGALVLSTPHDMLLGAVALIAIVLLALTDSVVDLSG